MPDTLHSTNRRILIIDDTPAIHEDFRKVLADQGGDIGGLNAMEAALFGEVAAHPATESFDIDSAHQGQEALEMVQTALAEGRPYALAFVDVRMPPGWDGIETIAHLWTVDAHLQAVICTAYSDYSWDETIAKLGQNDRLLILKKPFDDVEVRQLAHALVEKWNLGRQAQLRMNDLEALVHQRTQEIRQQNEQLKALQRHLEGSLRDTVGVLASLLETFSPALGIHSKRVAALARQLGMRLDLDAPTLRDVEFAAHLHDIGKVATFSTTQRDRSSQRPNRPPAYPEAGYAILARVSGFEKIVEGVRYQRERFDGTGTPKRRKGNAIPLASRIIALANAYDEAVFSGHTPTRPNRDQGRRVLEAGRGKAFDPHLVQPLLAHLDTPTDGVLTDSEVELSPKQLQVDMMLARHLKNVDGRLLMEAGTVLTPYLITRLRILSNSDLLLSGVFVKCADPEGP